MSEETPYRITYLKPGAITSYQCNRQVTGVSSLSVIRHKQNAKQKRQFNEVQLRGCKYIPFT